jgi:hypothetical protein
MIKCRECGYENMDGLDYCDGCGAKLESPAAAGNEGPAATSAAVNSPTSVGSASAGASEIGAAPSPPPGAETSAPAAPVQQSGAASEPSSSNEHVAAESEPSAANAPTGEISEVLPLHLRLSWLSSGEDDAARSLNWKPGITWSVAGILSQEPFRKLTWTLMTQRPRFPANML